MFAFACSVYLILKVNLIDLIYKTVSLVHSTYNIWINMNVYVFALKTFSVIAILGHN